MTTMLPIQAEPAGPPRDLESLYELLLAGGPMMLPIGLCSIVAVAFTVERWLRLRPGLLGSKRFGRSVVEATREGGVARGLEVARSKRSPLARILTLALERADDPFLDREKAVGDFASSEVRRLGSNLRPLLLVWLIAPLLGLLGTVWGMIEAFGEIATGDGMGKPELLASGIYQALTTTAAGLAVSIPAVVAYHHLRGRLEGFGRRIEDQVRELDMALRSAGGAEPTAASVEPEVARTESPAQRPARDSDSGAPPIPAAVPAGGEA